MLLFWPDARLEIAGERRTSYVPGRVWRLLPEREIPKHSSPIGKVLTVTSFFVSLFPSFFLFLVLAFVG